eukprot:4960622-Pyramimonas_sp.AAC.1
MDPDLPMVLDDAGNFFEQDEYEGACLDHGYSPFTREAPGDEVCVNNVTLCLSTQPMDIIHHYQRHHLL